MATSWGWGGWAGPGVFPDISFASAGPSQPETRRLLFLGAGGMWGEAGGSRSGAEKLFGDGVGVSGLLFCRQSPKLSLFALVLLNVFFFLDKFIPSCLLLPSSKDAGNRSALVVRALSAFGEGGCKETTSQWVK